MITIKSLPVSFIAWIRTKYTRNIKLLQYNYACSEVLILTDYNSRFCYLEINFFTKYLINQKKKVFF